MSQEVLISEVCPRIYYFDSRRFNPFGVSGVYLLADGGITLIETATTLEAPRIIEAVRKIGFQERDIHSAVLTHIHLDHAGASGWLANRLPHLRIYVHERGYKHMAEPSRLVESAKIVYGSKEAIARMHGEILPVPRENLVAVREGDLVLADGRKLKILDAPGHAPHHLCIFDPESDSLFSGEALGSYLPEFDTLYPAVAPPGFDYEASKSTISRIRDLAPGHVFFSQYGPHPDPARVPDEAARQLDYCYEFLKDRYLQDSSPEAIGRDLARHIFSGEGRLDWGTENTIKSVVLGYRAYFERNREHE